MPGGATGSSLLALALVAATVGLGIVVFNRLVRARERTREAWSAIDVQLKRRANLIPALIETVQGYATHERELFEGVARARSALAAATEPGPAATANEEVTRRLGPLYAVAEAYPELRASELFLRLQDELTDVEEKIAYARHFYNRNVEHLNSRIQSVPDVVVAALMGLRRFEFFSVDEGTRAGGPVTLERRASSSGSGGPSRAE